MAGCPARWVWILTTRVVGSLVQSLRFPLSLSASQIQASARLGEVHPSTQSEMSREEQIVEIAGGDAEKMGRLREIDSWFPTAKELNDEAFAARAAMDSEELAHYFPDFQAQKAMAALLWAMLEEECPVPAKRVKWAAFRSQIFGLHLPHAAEEEVVMGLAAPGTSAMPIEISDEEGGEPRKAKKKATVALFAALPESVSKDPGPLPSVGTPPAGSRFWLLARADSDDEEEDSLSDGSGNFGNPSKYLISTSHIGGDE